MGICWRAKRMFMGQYNHTIDTKGRVIIPSKFREELGEGFVVTVGLDRCLYLYPKIDWEKFTTELNQLPFTKEAREFQRYFMQNAAECEVDKQGRILIPNMLRLSASLEKEIIFVGVISKIEIWDKDRFEKESSGDSMEEIAERMAETYGLRF